MQTTITITVLIVVSIAISVSGNFRFNRQNLVKSNRYQPSACTNIKDGTDLQFSSDGRPVDVHANVGTPITLQCQVFGAPQPTIEWLKNDKPIDNINIDRSPARYELIANRRMTSVIGIAFVTSTLNIECVSESANYTCRAINGCNRMIESTAQLIVTNENNQQNGGDGVQSRCTSSIAMWTDSRLERPDTAAQLMCRVSSGLSTRWYRSIGDDDDDEEQVQLLVINDRNHLLLDNGDLLVKNSAGTDHGFSSYTCVVDDVAAAAASPMHLDATLFHINRRLNKPQMEKQRRLKFNHLIAELIQLLQSNKTTTITATTLREKATVLEHTVQVIQDATDRQLIEEFAIDRNNFQQFQTGWDKCQSDIDRFINSKSNGFDCELKSKLRQQIEACKCEKIVQLLSTQEYKTKSSYIPNYGNIIIDTNNSSTSILSVVPTSSVHKDEDMSQRTLFWRPWLIDNNDNRRII